MLFATKSVVDQSKPLFINIKNGGSMKNSIITVLAIILLLGINQIKAQDFKEVEKTFSLEKNGKVRIDTYKGEIVIETWDRDEVHVYAKIEPDGDGGFFSTKPKRQIESVRVEFNTSPGSVEIESVYRNNDSWFGSNTRALVNYKIKMPKYARLEIKDYKSETDISGLQAPIKLYTYKGEVRVLNLRGSIDLETYKGEVDVRFSDLTGDSSFDTYKGEIKITLPKETTFSINADFGRKTDFYSSFNIGENSQKNNRKDYGISEDVNGGGPEVRLSSKKGRFELLGK